MPMNGDGRGCAERDGCERCERVERWAKVDEVAAALQVTPNVVRNLARSGRVAVYRVPGDRGRVRVGVNAFGLPVRLSRS